MYGFEKPVTLVQFPEESEFLLLLLQAQPNAGALTAPLKRVNRAFFPEGKESLW